MSKETKPGRKLVPSEQRFRIGPDGKIEAVGPKRVIHELELDEVVPSGEPADEADEADDLVDGDDSE